MLFTRSRSVMGPSRNEIREENQWPPRSTGREADVSNVTWPDPSFYANKTGERLISLGVHQRRRRRRRSSVARRWTGNRNRLPSFELSAPDEWTVKISRKCAFRFFFFVRFLFSPWIQCFSLIWWGVGAEGLRGFGICSLREANFHSRHSKFR